MRLGTCISFQKASYRGYPFGRKTTNLFWQKNNQPPKKQPQQRSVCMFFSEVRSALETEIFRTSKDFQLDGQELNEVSHPSKRGMEKKPNTSWFGLDIRDLGPTWRIVP